MFVSSGSNPPTSKPTRQKRTQGDDERTTVRISKIHFGCYTGSSPTHDRNLSRYKNERHRHPPPLGYKSHLRQTQPALMGRSLPSREQSSTHGSPTSYNDMSFDSRNKKLSKRPNMMSRLTTPAFRRLVEPWSKDFTLPKLLGLDRLHAKMAPCFLYANSRTTLSQLVTRRAARTY